MENVRERKNRTKQGEAGEGEAAREGGREEGWRQGASPSTPWKKLTSSGEA